MKQQSRVFPKRRSRARSLAVLAVLTLGAMLSPLHAQAPVSNLAAPPDVLRADFLAPAGSNDGLQLTSCSSCGSYSGSCCGPRAPDLGGDAACCYPGRYPCDCCDCPKSCLCAFFQGVYHCVVCPDPCYEPTWKLLGNAAFFSDTVRPVTQMKVGADFGWNVRFPDKAELFLAQLNVRGPRLNGIVPNNANANTLDYQDLLIYNEAAVDRFSLFVVTPFRHFSTEVTPSGSGFGDLVVGTKSMLLDCELMQFTFQFRTIIPTGNVARGLGTGHTSLEPSLLTAIKITNADYLQAQLAYQFPIGGTSGFQGSLVTWGLSYNRLLWNCGKDLQLVGTLESNAWWITDGQFTVVGANGLVASVVRARELDTMWNLGCGLRCLMGQRIDVGVGFSGALTDDRMVGQLLRAEFRWRF